MQVTEGRTHPFGSSLWDVGEWSSHALVPEVTINFVTMVISS